MNKTINSYGTCAICGTQSIHYGIENGSYTYYCTKCNKSITTSEVLTIKEAEKRECEHDWELITSKIGNIHNAKNCKKCNIEIWKWGERYEYIKYNLKGGEIIK